MKDYKYFIEIAHRDNINGYILQSDIFDTEEQAIEWTNYITYCSRDYNIKLICIELDRETGIYSNIYFVKCI